MQVTLTPFHTLDIAEGLTLHFPTGILGFPDIKDYRLVDQGTDIPFKWLQAQEIALAFVIVDPFLFLPDYRVDIGERDLQELAVSDQHRLSLLVIVTLPWEQVAEMTVNLQGPILVNSDNGLAKQLVLVNGPYHTRHFLVPQLKAVR